MLDAATIDQDIAGLALAGLTAPRKTLPPKLFYDDEGVRLFEAITRLPEYYLTRTESVLLAQSAAEIASLAAPRSVLVEYGASDEGKARFLLDAVEDRFTAYVPIDVASGALGEMSARLKKSHLGLRVHPYCGDFLRPIVLPVSTHGLAPFGFFPGSTIGNLDPDSAQRFLGQAAITLGAGAWLIVGVDLRKDPSLLVPAYDDAAGVTAAFNLNLLRRLNREAAADFVLGAFQHVALWNDAAGRIEMHLQSRADQTVHLAGEAIRFREGETIHTENSYKHSIEGFQSLAMRAGWQPRQVWTDTERMFAVHALAAP